MPSTRTFSRKVGSAPTHTDFGGVLPEERNVGPVGSLGRSIHRAVSAAVAAALLADARDRGEVLSDTLRGAASQTV